MDIDECECRLQSHNQLDLKVSWTGFDCFNMADGLCIEETVANYSAVEYCS